MFIHRPQYAKMQDTYQLAMETFPWTKPIFHFHFKLKLIYIELDMENNYIDIT